MLTYRQIKLLLRDLFLVEQQSTCSVPAMLWAQSLAPKPTEAALHRAQCLYASQGPHMPWDHNGVLLMSERPACCDHAQLLVPGDPTAGITSASDQVLPSEAPLGDACPALGTLCPPTTESKIVFGNWLTSLGNLSALQSRTSGSPQTLCSVITWSSPKEYYSCSILWSVRQTGQGMSGI